MTGTLAIARTVRIDPLGQRRLVHVVPRVPWGDLGRSFTDPAEARAYADRIAAEHGWRVHEAPPLSARERAA